MGPGYRRIKLERPASAHSYGVRHHQALRRIRAADICTVSPSRASSVKPTAAAHDSDRLLAGHLEFLLEFTGQLDEARREADVLVERIAMIVARNDLGTSFVGHGGRNFIQTGAQ
jgi:hypothetical protein